MNAGQPPRRRVPAGRLRWLDPRLLAWLILAGTVQAALVAGALAGFAAPERSLQKPLTLSLLSHAPHRAATAHPGAPCVHVIGTQGGSAGANAMASAHCTGYRDTAPLQLQSRAL